MLCLTTPTRTGSASCWKHLSLAFDTQSARSPLGTRISGLFALALLLCSCMSVLHPIRDEQDEARRALAMVPVSARERVHIFILHGLDPFDYANLAGLRGYCADLGFPNTWLGQFYHAGRFAAEIRSVAQDDPGAGLVLIGFSAGANAARDVATSLQEDGITIDLLVYMGGNTLADVPDSRPENVRKVIHILATGYVFKGTAITGAENYKYAQTWHFGSPSHPHTLAILRRELLEVAERVGAEAGDQPMPKDASSADRRVSYDLSSRVAWDFLEQAQRLREP